MAKVKEIYAFIDRIAPFAYQMKTDNSGLLIGDREREVKKIMISLDITEPVILEAIENKVDLLLSHHPFFFDPYKAITDETYHGRMALKLIENRISIICAHTNLDSAKGGINDVLCKKIGLPKPEMLRLDDNADAGILRYGEYEKPMTMEEFLKKVKAALRADKITYTGELSDTVRRVAVCSGSGASFMDLALSSGADTYFMGEAKYGNAQYAIENGMNVVLAGHFETEDIICEVLLDQINREFEGLSVTIADNDRNMIRYY